MQKTAEQIADEILDKVGFFAGAARMARKAVQGAKKVVGKKPTQTAVKSMPNGPPGLHAAFKGKGLSSLGEKGRHVGSPSAPNKAISNALVRNR